jgi:proteasome lid subunit RPN8/RPN11
MIELADNVREAIIAHAKQQDPRETCGIVHITKGRQRYRPCRNIAATPSENFTLHPEDYAAAEDDGEIIAIVHSHPTTPPAPSAADQLSCNATGLPWVIVNPKTEQWGYCAPKDLELPYVGRQFVFGVVDCYALVRDWYRREWGLMLDDFNRSDRFWERGENLYLDNYKSQGFHQVPMEELQYGDAILMQLGAKLPNHAAVYIGDQLILHHIQDRLSSRDVYGGYYVKSTAMVLRHESR